MNVTLKSVLVVDDDPAVLRALDRIPPSRRYHDVVRAAIHAVAGAATLNERQKEKLRAFIETLIDGDPDST